MDQLFLGFFCQGKMPPRAEQRRHLCGSLEKASERLQEINREVYSEAPSLKKIKTAICSSMM